MSGYSGNDGGAFGNTRDSGYGSGNSGNMNNYDNNKSTNSGPHSSNLLNKMDPRVDSDRDGSRTTTGNTGTGAGYGSSNTSGHSGYGGNTQYDNPRSTNEGPHNSNFANMADPRVDSDRDGRTGLGNTTGSGYGNSNTGAGYGSKTGSGYGTGNTTGQHHHHHHNNHHEGGLGGNNNTQYDNPRSTNEGPHSSNIANKADPRVDSDRDGRGNYGTGNTLGGNNTGSYGSNTGNYGSNTGNYGSNTGNTGSYGSNTGSGYGSGTNNPNYNNPESTNAGPHSSNIANKLDPRVDSDRDGRTGLGNNNNNTGSGYGNNTGSGYGNNTGSGYGNNTGSGFGNTNTANEPTTISSNAEGRGNGASTGSAQPHKSRLSNILDPRVDSNAGAGHGANATATANASVSGAGPTGAPEGQASASGPGSANANTTTTNNPISKGINKLTGRS